MTARGWIANRLGETSTYVGGALIACSQLNFSGVAPSNTTLQTALDTFHTWAPIIGASIMAMSTKHP